MSVKPTYRELEKRIKELEKDILKSDNALSVSKQKLDMHFMQAPLAVIEWDLEFNVRSWNPAAENIFGYTKEEIIGKHASIIIPDEDKETINNVWLELLQQKGGTRSTNSNLTKNAKVIWCEWFNTPVIDNSGDIIAVFSLVQNITDRIDTLKTLKESEERYRTLVDTASEIIVTIDTEGKFLLVNRTAANYLGGRPEDYVGKNLWDVFTKDEADQRFSEQLDIIAKGKRKREVHKRNIKGRTFWFDTSLQPIQDNQGKIISVLTIATDITKKKLYEERLVASENQFQKLLNSIHDVVWASDLEGQMLYINPAAKTVYGHELIDFYTNSQLWSEMIHPDDRDRVLKESEDLLQTGNIETQYRVVRPNGQVRWVNDKKSVVYDTKGNPIQIGGIASDITKEKKALDENKKANRALSLYSESNKIIVHAKNESDMLHHICMLIVKKGSYRFSWIGFAGQDKDKKVSPAASYKFIEGYLENLDITWADTKQGQGPIGTAIREARHVISTNVSADPKFSPWKQKTDNLETISVIALPLIFEEHCFGSLNIHASHEDAFRKEEVSLLEELTNDLAHGIMALRLQEKNRQTELSLQMERDKLKGVINGITDQLHIISKDFTIEFQNEVSLLEYGNLIGKKCHEVLYHQVAPCDFCLMRESLEQKCIRQAEVTLPDKKTYESVYSSFQTSTGEMKCIVVSRDVTEKKALQAETMRAGHLASIGELAAGVAHEINNPVTGIISIAEILADKFHDLGGDRTIPERIIREGERIGKIVKNLLSFARDKKDEHSPALIQDILGLALELVEKQIMKDGIHLSVTMPPELPKIKARTYEIQQVFINLLSNARYAIMKKQPDTQEKKVIDISGEVIEFEDEMFVRITFYDNGAGIPKEMIENITTPFFSTKPQGEGTGLGLSISHGIIKNHDGRLFFETQEGEYTKVMVDLPVYRDNKV